MYWWKIGSLATPTSEPEIDFFISRAGADRKIASDIAHILQNAGRTTLLQDTDFGHKSFMAMMAKGWSSGARLICILSNHYQESEFCKSEYETVLAKDPRNLLERVIVFRVGNCSPVEHLTAIPFIDLVPILNNAGAIERAVLTAIGHPEKKTDYVDGAAKTEADVPDDYPILHGKTFRHFVHEIDLAKAKRIMVFATVGSVTIRQLRQVLRDRAIAATGNLIDVHVLLSSGALTSAKRATAVRDTMLDLNGFAAEQPCYSVEVRSYSSPPVFRGAIVEHEDGACGGYIAYYYWGIKNALCNRPSADEHGLLVEPTKESHAMLTIFRSWFSHFWGAGNVNTILFDFDDTIFDTLDAQVAGWVEAIKRVAAEDWPVAASFSDEIKSKLSVNEDLSPLVRMIFLSEQNADKILRRILPVDLPIAIKKAFHEYRLAVRIRETLAGGTPIARVLDDVKLLHKKYRLIIVSAASEKMIEDTLAKSRPSLANLFSFVFGRSADEFDSRWDGIEAKSQRFLRISAMLGVPLDRMVFVGDSDSDYRAARQLGIHFIENRYSAHRNGRETLLKASRGTKHHHITGVRAGELIKCIEEIENDIKERGMNRPGFAGGWLV